MQQSKGKVLAVCYVFPAWKNVSYCCRSASQARSAPSIKQTASVARVNKRLLISHSDNKTHKKYRTHHSPSPSGRGPGRGDQKQLLRFKGRHARMRPRHYRAQRGSDADGKVRDSNAIRPISMITAGLCVLDCTRIVDTNNNNHQQLFINDKTKYQSYTNYAVQISSVATACTSGNWAYPDPVTRNGCKPWAHLPQSTLSVTPPKPNQGSASTFVTRWWTDSYVQPFPIHISQTSGINPHHSKEVI